MYKKIGILLSGAGAGYYLHDLIVGYNPYFANLLGLWFLAAFLLWATFGERVVEFFTGKKDEE
jgi:hypothetical protein